MKADGSGAVGKVDTLRLGTGADDTVLKLLETWLKVAATLGLLLRWKVALEPGVIKL